MYEVLTKHPPDLIDTLRETWPRIGELFADLEVEQPMETRLGRLRHIGAIWYAQGGTGEVLVELGMALAEHLCMPQALVVSEMMLAFSTALHEQRTREWETHLLNRVTQLDGLHRIICAANSTLDLDASLQTVVETVAQVVGVEVCSIYLYDFDRHELVLHATCGVNYSPVEQVVTQIGQGVTGWAAQVGAPVAVRDIMEDPRFACEPQLGNGTMRSMMAVPIVLFSAERFQFSTDKLQGVIGVQTKGPRDFPQEEINFVEVVAGELAFFITNAQLYQQTDERLHQKIRELTTLQHVSKHIAEQVGLRDVLNLIAEKAVELASADRADIFQINDENGTLHLVASYGGAGVGEVHRFAQQTVDECKPIAILDAYQDPRFPGLEYIAAREGFHSIFCMPLRARERGIGSICLYTKQPHHFDYDQVRLLSTFADEAAIAIENARLYDESLRALAVKSAMLQEMHHRVRNNLQTISALLAMQLRRIDTDSRGGQALRESVARIQSIAAVHNLLCRADVGVTTIEAVARQVIESASTGLLSAERPVHFNFLGDTVRVGSHDATILALIINELISNALTHGMAAEGGNVEVEATIDNGTVIIEVRDDGPMHPQIPESSHGSGLGLQIIQTLVMDDLGGTFELLQNHGDQWMRAQVRFPHRLEHQLPDMYDN